MALSIGTLVCTRRLQLTLDDCAVRVQISLACYRLKRSWSRGQISNFEFCCTPKEEKVGYYFQSGTCLGASEIHVLLSFLWSIFCKWPVITVTTQTLKIAVHKIQD